MAAGGLAALLVIPWATAVLLDRIPPVQTAGMRAFPIQEASTISRLPVADFPTEADGGDLALGGLRNPHHPCLTVAEWVIALHSIRNIRLDKDCRLVRGSWTGLFTGRSTDDPSEMTLLPVIPARLAMAAGLKDRPDDLMRWRAPTRDEAWLWIPGPAGGAVDRGMAAGAQRVGLQLCQALVGGQDPIPVGRQAGGTHLPRPTAGEVQRMNPWFLSCWSFGSPFGIGQSLIRQE